MKYLSSIMLDQYSDLPRPGDRVRATLVALKIKHMAQPPHFDVDGSIYFVTTSLSQKTRSFSEGEAKERSSFEKNQ